MIGKQWPWLYLAIIGIHGEQLEGDSLCPCVGFIPDLTEQEIVDYETSEWNTGNLTSYGIGCKNHDFLNQACADYKNCIENGIEESTYLEIGDTQVSECPNAWCARSWCFVSTNKCDKLGNQPTVVIPNRNLSYSYATCGQVDYFETEAKLSSLRNQTFNVGFNHNSGGWTGSYSRNKEHFLGPSSLWYGPSVEFIREAARVGGFRVNITSPPEKLMNDSSEYFSDSRFDLCVYATGLGYLDFCVASYTITNKRAITADWFILNSLPLYLVTQDVAEPTSIEVFKQKFLTIFKPFSGSTWLLVMFGFLPFLAFSMMTQELGVKGSEFPTTERKTIENENDLPPEEKEVKYPMWKNVNRAFYRSFLAYLRRSYGHPVQTYGGAWTVLAYSFIGMIGMSLYTAQMAAHLTTQALDVGVKDIDGAIRAGYRFCGERKNVQIIMDKFNIADRFVRDPVELGGDGEPGFNCAHCNSLFRTIEFLDPVKAETDSRYCHVALASTEELEIVHGSGVGCNKGVSGQPLAYKQFGFPLANQFGKELESLFITLKNNGVFEKKQQDARPESSCTGATSQAMARSLTPYDLIGIWITCGGFAIIGLIISFVERRRALNEAAKKVATGSVRLRQTLRGGLHSLRNGKARTSERSESASSNSTPTKNRETSARFN